MGKKLFKCFWELGDYEKLLPFLYQIRYLFPHILRAPIIFQQIYITKWKSLYSPWQLIFEENLNAPQLCTPHFDCSKIYKTF